MPAEHLRFVGWEMNEVTKYLVQCVMKSVSQRKGNKGQRNERIMRIMVARSCPGLLSASLMLAYILLLPNHAVARLRIPMKEGVCFPEVLALPLQPCFVSLCACCEPSAACCLCWVTDSTNSSSFCGSGTCRVWRSGTEGFARQQVTEGMGPAEERYCMLEARALSYDEDERKQAEKRHATATGTVLCRDRERALKHRKLMSLPSC